MSMPLRPDDPASLGRFELIGRLGEGGMGTVYLGRGPDGRLVAIKMVRTEFAHDAEFRARFRSEVSRAQQVPSFSTAEVLEADPDHEPPYLVVEYVDGPSLAAEMREKGPLTGAALHGVAVGIATALTAIHGAGVIHRDLKPGNVLFARGGIKVIDFGIARAFEATSQHTRTDQMVGTVAYMAPERFDSANGRPVTAAADIFAWGAVVTYTATGRTPFAAESAPATAMRILTQEPELGGLPDSLRGLVARALAKEPADRPTARELLDLLLAGGTPRPAEVTVPAAAPAAAMVPPRARRRRTAAALITAAAVLVAAGAGAAIRYLPLDNRQTTGAEPAASSSASPARTPAAARSLSAAEKLQDIMRGTRKTLIHVVEIDRDLAMDYNLSEVEDGDGTGAKSEFQLIPTGVDFLIRALYDPADKRTCLGVRINPDPDSNLPDTMVKAECFPTLATVFALLPTGRNDEHGRPTYHIKSDEHGFLQWSPSREAFYVQPIGDAEPGGTFSFVDRGPVAAPSPGG